MPCARPRRRRPDRDDRSSTRASVRSRGDPDRLQQIVWNLLNNSVKFTNKGGRIVVTLRAEGSDAVLCVKDKWHRHVPPSCCRMCSSASGKALRRLRAPRRPRHRSRARAPSRRDARRNGDRESDGEGHGVVLHPASADARRASRCGSTFARVRRRYRSHRRLLCAGGHQPARRR